MLFTPVVCENTGKAHPVKEVARVSDMKLNARSSFELATLLRSGEITTSTLVAACRARIELREPQVNAWQHLDWEQVQREIARVEAMPLDQRGVLWGIPVGIKDVFDTHDLPTSYGSRIYEMYRPAQDAACVARLRAAGAIVLGKTVTTEFAFLNPGKTRNPHDLTRTPGGSSQGSAAAVADQMVPLAIGTQTAASTIRPASYCGVVGFKPSYGRVSCAGVKTLASGLDTVGLFARSIEEVAAMTAVMTHDATLTHVAALPEAPSLRIWCGPELNQADDDALTVLDRASRLVEAAGGRVEREDLSPCMSGLGEVQLVVMSFEMARDLAYEFLNEGERLSPKLADFIERGMITSLEAYTDALRLRADALQNIDDIFAGAEVLVLPSATGKAPPAETGTGDPIMCRAWTLLGLPSISIPYPNRSGGLPIGLQLAARPGDDAKLLAAALWFETAITTNVG